MSSFPIYEMASRLIESDTPELFPGPIYPKRPAIGREDLDAQGGLLNYVAEALLRQLQLLLNLLTLSNVLGNRDEIHGLVGGVAQERRS